MSRNEEKYFDNKSSDLIKVKKSRFFFEFKTPFLLEVTEELSLSNEGQPIYKYIYYLDQCRSNFHIYDSDGQSLLFFVHKLSEYEYNTKLFHEINFKYRYIVEILFPKGKPLDKGESRIVKLQYTIKIKYISPVQSSRLHYIYKRLFIPQTTLFVPLYKRASNYLFIKECQGYELSIFKLEYVGNIEEKCISGKNSKDNSFFDRYYCLKDNYDSNLWITLGHKIPSSRQSWYLIGLFSGAFSFLFILFTYSSNKLDIECYLALASLIITLLTIIKTWLFEKNMYGILIIYDLTYRITISLIIFEILIIGMYFIKNQPTFRT